MNTVHPSTGPDDVATMHRKSSSCSGVPSVGSSSPNAADMGPSVRTTERPHSSGVPTAADVGVSDHHHKSTVTIPAEVSPPRRLYGDPNHHSVPSFGVPTATGTGDQPPPTNILPTELYAVFPHFKMPIYAGKHHSAIITQLTAQLKEHRKKQRKEQKRLSDAQLRAAVFGESAPAPSKKASTSSLVPGLYAWVLNPVLWDPAPSRTVASLATGPRQGAPIQLAARLVPFDQQLRVEDQDEEELIKTGGDRYVNSDHLPTRPVGKAIGVPELGDPRWRFDNIEHLLAQNELCKEFSSGAAQHYYPMWVQFATRTSFVLQILHSNEKRSLPAAGTKVVASVPCGGYKGGIQRRACRRMGDISADADFLVAEELGEVVQVGAGRDTTTANAGDPVSAWMERYVPAIPVLVRLVGQEEWDLHRGMHQKSDLAYDAARLREVRQVTSSIATLSFSLCKKRVIIFVSQATADAEDVRPIARLVVQSKQAPRDLAVQWHVLRAGECVSYNPPTDTTTVRPAAPPDNVSEMTVYLAVNCSSSNAAIRKELLDPFGEVVKVLRLNHMPTGPKWKLESGVYAQFLSTSQAAACIAALADGGTSEIRKTFFSAAPTAGSGDGVQQYARYFPHKFRVQAITMAVVEDGEILEHCTFGRRSHIAAFDTERHDYLGSDDDQSDCSSDSSEMDTMPRRSCRREERGRNRSRSIRDHPSRDQRSSHSRDRRLPRDHNREKGASGRQVNAPPPDANAEFGGLVAGRGPAKRNRDPEEGPSGFAGSMQESAVSITKKPRPPPPPRPGVRAKVEAGCPVTGQQQGHQSLSPPPPAFCVAPERLAEVRGWEQQQHAGQPLQSQPLPQQMAPSPGFTLVQQQQQQQPTSILRNTLHHVRRTRPIQWNAEVESRKRSRGGTKNPPPSARLTGCRLRGDYLAAALELKRTKETMALTGQVRSDADKEVILQLQRALGEKGKKIGELTAVRVVLQFVERSEEPEWNQIYELRGRVMQLEAEELDNIFSNNGEEGAV